MLTAQILPTQGLVAATLGINHPSFHHSLDRRHSPRMYRGRGQSERAIPRTATLPTTSRGETKVGRYLQAAWPRARVSCRRPHSRIPTLLLALTRSRLLSRTLRERRQKRAARSVSEVKQPRVRLNTRQYAVSRRSLS